MQIQTPGEKRYVSIVGCSTVLAQSFSSSSISLFTDNLKFKTFVMITVTNMVNWGYVMWGTWFQQLMPSIT